MPYYLIPTSEVERVTQYADFIYMPDYPTYPTRQLAHEAKQAQTENVTVVFLQNYSEREAWHGREYSRFGDGSYVHVPNDWRYAEPRGRFLHRSIKQPGMIAFTKDNEAGHLDKQTIMRPGRYLEEFHKGTFTPEQIASFIAEISADATDCQDLHIARSIADIRTIYNASGLGFCSCMQRKAHVEYDWQKRMDREEIDHPATVYGDSDLGVAYRGPIERVLQRAVVWPDKKQFVRIYGDGCLRQTLERAGYTKVCGFEGARIHRVALSSGGYLMPYLDGTQSIDVSDNPAFFIITAKGDISATETCGSVCDSPDEDDDYVTCGNCGERYDENRYDNSTEEYCSSCMDDYTSCERCGNLWFDGSSTTTVDGEEWCDHCVENYTAICTDCEEIFRTDRNAFSREQQRVREAHGLTDRCRDCADNYTYCDACETLWIIVDHDGCPTCERDPRCEATGDLLATVDHDSAMCAAVPIINSVSDESPF